MKTPLLILPLLLLLSGCGTWRDLSPGAQSAIKSAAKAALVIGVNQLGDRVKELRPYQGKLNALIETTFAKPLDAEATGAALKEGVVKAVPPEHQAAVLSEFRVQLRGAPAAGSRKGSEFNTRLADAL